VEHKENLGFKNKAGQKIIPPQYTEVKPFSEGLSAVKKEGRWGYIDKTGKVIIPFQFLEALSFSQGIAFADRGTGYQLIDKSGKFLYPETYEDALPFSEGLAAVSKKGKWGFINTKGELVIPYRYKFVSGFQDGVSICQTEKGLGYLDKTGREFVPPQYQMIRTLKENAGWLLRSGMWYKTNRQGILVDSLSEKAVSLKESPAKKEIYAEEVYQLDANSNLKKIRKAEMNSPKNEDLVPHLWYRGIWYYVDQAGNPFYEESDGH
jgi:hypothetical protein